MDFKTENQVDLTIALWYNLFNAIPPYRNDQKVYGCYDGKQAIHDAKGVNF